MSWHTNCRGKSLGRILHFIYYYAGFDVMENCTVGNGEVHYHGEKIATFEWLSDLDIPHFKFIQTIPKIGQYYIVASAQQVSEWEEAQKEKVFEAISEAEDTKPEPCEECRSLKLKLDIWTDGKWRKE